jgi:hypothetical protein
MDSNTFSNCAIYTSLRDEFIEFKDWNSWREFIDYKDIGIKVSGRNKKSNNGYYRYTIVDDKKWFITKLKYGF